MPQFQRYADVRSIMTSQQNTGGASEAWKDLRKLILVPGHAIYVGNDCSLLKFVNAVAEAIEPDHPNIRIDALAAHYARTPPRTIRPRHNVIMRLCSGLAYAASRTHLRPARQPRTNSSATMLLPGARS